MQNWGSGDNSCRTGVRRQLLTVESQRGPADCPAHGSNRVIDPLHGHDLTPEKRTCENEVLRPR